MKRTRGDKSLQSEKNKQNRFSSNSYFTLLTKPFCNMFFNIGKCDAFKFRIDMIFRV